MIGIGVAVDYSLFVLARYREEIHARARRPTGARRPRWPPPALAVLFSGVTVMASLAGLFLDRHDRDPLDGDRRDPRRRRGDARLGDAAARAHQRSLRPPRAGRRGRLSRRAGAAGAAAPGAAAFWARWTGVVMRRPCVAVVAASAILLALALPGAATWRPSNGALRQLDPADETRQGFAAAAAMTGPGASAPVHVVAASASGTSPTRNAARSRGRPRERRATAPRGRGRRARGRPQRRSLLAELRHDGESDAGQARGRRAARRRCPATERARQRRRDHRRARTTSASSSPTRCGRSCCSSSACRTSCCSCCCAAVVLPLKAVLMNLLSVGAAYGVLALVFDDGRRDHAAARARGRLRPVDGLRGVPAQPDPRALRRDRRHAARGRRGPGHERADDHQRRADHGRRLPGLRRHRAAVDPADRPRQRGGDRASTRRSCGSCSCPPRWSCWAAGTGGCRARSPASCPSAASTSSPPPRGRARSRPMARCATLASLALGKTTDPVGDARTP